MLCMSDTVYGAVLGVNYTVASLLIHKIASHTYIMCFKWAPKDCPVFFKSVAYCTWSTWLSLPIQKKATLTSYVFGLIRRVVRNEELQLLIQITHCQVHIPCTNTCVKRMKIYVKFNIKSKLSILKRANVFFKLTVLDLLLKTINVDLRQSRLNPPEQKHFSQHITETSCETQYGFMWNTMWLSETNEMVADWPSKKHRFVALVFGTHKI